MEERGEKVVYFDKDRNSLPGKTGGNRDNDFYCNYRWSLEIIISILKSIGYFRIKNRSSFLSDIQHGRHV